MELSTAPTRTAMAEQIKDLSMISKELKTIPLKRLNKMKVSIHFPIKSKQISLQIDKILDKFLVLPNHQFIIINSILPNNKLIIINLKLFDKIQNNLQIKVRIIKVNQHNLLINRHNLKIQRKIII